LPGHGRRHSVAIQGAHFLDIVGRENPFEDIGRDIGKMSRLLQVPGTRLHGVDGSKLGRASGAERRRDERRTKSAIIV